jgi:predicted TIM-barrel fold metal-dependent hydrolase
MSALHDAVSEAASLRAQLEHPIVDVDGHIVESLPALVEVIRKIGGSEVADRFGASSTAFASRSGGTGADAPATGVQPELGQAMGPWWSLPRDTLDRATGFLPRLLHERLDELGIDFSILYPSVGLVCGTIPDDELRRAASRALNLYQAEQLAGLDDRLVAAATIPTHTPEEAIEELEYAVGTLGFKVAAFNSFVERPLPPGGRRSHWIDVLALDSPYDYDPLWRRCAELGIAVTVHSHSVGIGMRQSSSRYMYNHIGSFATSGEAFAKALFFGGVLQRFPSLNFAFLECGVSWGVQLLADLIDRWSKRGGKQIETLDPSGVDPERWDELLREYGGETFASPDMRRATLAQSDNPPVELDDFRETGIQSARDIVRQFGRFFFGCEADDASIPLAFSRATNPQGAALQPVIGSDLGHWDVSDMREVVPEAIDLVDEGRVSAEDFREFTCTNPIRLHGGMNRDFFEGTPVAQEARRVLDA